MRYTWLRKLHFGLSLAVALPLLLLSLTGALLVYGQELEALIEPERRSVERPSPDAQPLPFSTLVARVAEQEPEVRIWSMGLGRHPEDVWTLWLADGAGVLSLDPYSGEVVERYRPDERLYGFVVALHRRWLTSDQAITPWVRDVISAVSLILILQMLVGLWMWLLPPKRLARLKVDFRRSPRSVVLRLHQVSGVSTALILATVAFTGLAMHWHGPARTVVEWVTGQEIVEGEPDLPELDPGEAGLPGDLDATVALGRAVFPDARLQHFRMPRPGKPLMMGLKPEEGLGSHRVWVGNDPPRVLASESAADANGATWFWRARYWIHTGDFAGPVVRALWLVVALLPAGFAISGLWLHLDRRKRARAGRRARLAVEAASRA